jgi:DNA polymerase III epsilon subunit-like protein
VDVESTGLNPFQNSITEIDCICYDSFEDFKAVRSPQTYQTPIRPHEPITEKMVEEQGIELCEAMKAVNDIIPEGIWVIGDGSLSFDKWILNEKSKLCLDPPSEPLRDSSPGKNNIVTWKWIDALRLAQQVYLTGNSLKNLSSAERCHIESQVHHRAMSDVLTTKNVYRCLTEESLEFIYERDFIYY